MRVALPPRAVAQTAAAPAQVVSRTKRAPSFSRDGKRIVYVETQRDNRTGASTYHLRVVNTDGTGERNLVDSEHIFDFGLPRFSPDGKWVVFTQLKKGTYDIWLAATDGTGLKQMTNTPSPESKADFSSDGKFVFFLRDEDSQGGIAMRLSLADGRESKLFAKEMRVQDVSAAPGGKAYVVCDYCGGGEVGGLPAVMLISFDGSAPHLVMTLTGKVFKFRAAQETVRVGIAMEEQFATSGDIMEEMKKRNEALLSGKPKKNEIHLVDGTRDEKLIADAESHTYNFDLSADGKWLVYTGKPTPKHPEALWLYEVEKKAWSRVMSPEEAAKEATQAAARKHYESAMALGQAKRFDEAIVQFNEAIKLMPNEPLLYRNRALTHAFKGDTASALKDFAELIRLAPNVPDAYVQRGMLLAQTNKFEEAAADFTEAIRLGPANKQLYLARAQIYRKLGKIAPAVADESKANSMSVK